MVREYPQIGTVEFIERKQATRITLRVLPQGIVRVSMPHKRMLSMAESFVLQKTDWILAVKERVVVPNELFTTQKLITPFHDLRFVEVATKAKPKAKISDSEIIIFHSNIDSINSNEIQELTRNAIITSLKIKAKEIIPQRLQELSNKINIPYTSVSINSATGRWGSCSAKDTINISFRTIILAEELVDYILIHELCHVVHKNHGPQFHALLQSFLEKPESYYNKAIRKCKRIV